MTFGGHVCRRRGPRVVRVPERITLVQRGADVTDKSVQVGVLLYPGCGGEPTCTSFTRVLVQAACCTSEWGVLANWDAEVPMEGVMVAPLRVFGCNDCT